LTEVGWIKLHRQIRNSEFYKEPRKFSKNEAWIDILLRANHEQEIIIIDGNEVSIPIGSFATSYYQLYKTWGWDKKTVSRFINYLIQEKMVEIRDPKLSPISSPKVSPKTSPKVAQNSPLKNESLPIIYKEEKNIKKGYAEFVFLTEDEYQRLLTDYGEEDLLWMIDFLNNYLGYNEKKRKEYTSHNHVIRGWVKDKLTEEKKKNPQVAKKSKQESDPYEFKRSWE
jgi:hypothetical protein